MTALAADAPVAPPVPVRVRPQPSAQAASQAALQAVRAAAPAPQARGGRRVALYSHDTQGLGHVRRNIEIARVLLTARPDTEVLLLSGAAEAVNLPRPREAELVVLPSVSKSARGEYAATSLRLDLPEVLRLRGALVASAVAGFRPDVLVVDKEARGLRGELDPALDVVARTAGAGGARTKLVLGLRDVLDAPVEGRLEWERSRTTQTLLSAYDAVWVYGDQRVHDLGVSYDLPDEVRRMMRFTGYLAQGRHRATDLPEGAVPDEPYVLCLVGGGQDGCDLARSFAAATLPEGHRGVLVTGPFMPAGVRRELDVEAARRDDLTVLGFVDHVPSLVDRAAAVVTMGGYNSVCELLASGRPGLVVPRVVPRLEQAVRAEQLARHTHLDCLRPEALTDRMLSRWLVGAVREEGGSHELDLDGLARVPRLLDELMAPPVPPTVPLTPPAPRALTPVEAPDARS